MAYDGSLIFDTKIDKKGFEKGVGELGKVSKKAFGAVTKSVAAISTAVVGVGAASVKVGSDFEAGMSGVAATMGITVDEINNGSESFEMLKKAAKEAGKTTKFSATESSEALNYLALAGYDAEKSVQALPTVLNLAAAGGLELGYASDLVTDSMSALGMETDELEGFVDELAKTSQKSNTDIGQLGEAILNIGGTAKIMAGGTVELNTQLGILADNGIKGSEGGVALRNVLLSLSAPTDKQAKAMKQLGIDTYDANGNFRSTDDIFQELNGTLGQMDEQERTEVLSKLFNKVDLKAANALLDGSGERFEELSKQVANADGSAENMAETLNDNLKGKIGLLGSALEGLGIEIYENVDTPINSVVDTFTDYIGQITEVLTRTEDTKAKLEELGLTAEDLGLNIEEIPSGFSGMVEVLGDIITDMILKIVEAIPGFLEAGVDIINALLEGVRENQADVTAAAIETITLLLDAFFDIMPQVIDIGIDVIWSLIDGINQTEGNLMQEVSDLIVQLLSSFIEMLPEILNIGVRIILELIQGISESLPKLIPVAFEAVFQFVEGLLDNIDLLIDAAIALITGLSLGLINSIPIILEKAPIIVNKLVDALVNNAGKASRAAVELMLVLAVELIKQIPNLLKSIPKIVKAVLNAFTVGFKVINTIGKNIIQGLWEGMKSMTSWIVNKTKDLANSIAGSFKGVFGIKSPSTLMAGYGKNIVEGLEIGVKDNQSKAERAMKDMANSIVDEYDNLGNATTKALKKQYKEEERLQIKSLEEQSDRIKKKIKERIANYNEELEVKVKILSDATEKETTELQKQIDAIDNKTKREEKSLKEQEYNNQVSLKRKEIQAAKSSKERIKIQSELNKMIADKERERVLESRDLQTQALKVEMDKLKEQAAKKQKLMEEEQQARVDMAQFMIKEYDRFGNAVITALKGKYSEEERLQLESLRKQTDNLRDETDRRLKEYEKEYEAKLRVLNIETDEEVKAIQDQIDAINNKTKEEERLLKEQGYNNKVASKEKEILESESNEERLKLQDELTKIRAEKEKENIIEQRNKHIDSLRDEMDRIRNQSANKKKELEDEFNRKKDNENKKLNSSIKYYEDEILATKTHYEALLNEESMQAEARKLMLDENNQELVSLLESYNPHWQNAGQSFGESLLYGLNSTKTSIQSEVDDILSMINLADKSNAQIIQAKKDWESANELGDKKGMEEAHKRAEEARNRGGTIKATDSMKMSEEYIKKSQGEMGQRLSGDTIKNTNNTSDTKINNYIDVKIDRDTPVSQGKDVGREIGKEFGKTMRGKGVVIL